MVIFLYFAGMIVSFVVLAYLDVKGNAFFDMKPRAEVYDASDRVMFGGFGCLLWPLTIMLLSITLFYRGLLYIFSRQPKKSKIWTCPCIKPANNYRDSIEHCVVKTRSTERPKCGVHHCEMVEDL